MKALKNWAPASFVLLLLQQLPEPCEGQTLPTNQSLSGCEMEVLTGTSSDLGCYCLLCLSVAPSDLCQDISSHHLSMFTALRCDLSVEPHSDTQQEAP